MEYYTLSSVYAVSINMKFHLRGILKCCINGISRKWKPRKRKPRKRKPRKRKPRKWRRQCTFESNIRAQNWTQLAQGNIRFFKMYHWVIIHLKKLLFQIQNFSYYTYIYLKTFWIQTFFEKKLFLLQNDMYYLLLDPISFFSFGSILFLNLSGHFFAWNREHTLHPF